MEKIILWKYSLLRVVFFLYSDYLFRSEIRLVFSPRVLRGRIIARRERIFINITRGRIFESITPDVSWPYAFLILNESSI